MYRKNLYGYRGLVGPLLFAEVLNQTWYGITFFLASAVLVLNAILILTVKIK